MSEGYTGLPAYYAQSSDPLTPNLGLSLKGADPIVAENFVLIDTAIGSGGTTVKVNGSVIHNPNFNGTTPAAPGGSTNVIWQFDGSGNVSAYITASGGTPAGPPNSIQFNNSGAFGGLSNFVIDPASGEVTITDTSASFLGLAALSVFGNAQGDNIQDWYMDGSTAGTPDVYLDPSGDLIFTGSQVIFCKTIQSLSSSAALQLDGPAVGNGFALFDDAGNNSIFGGASLDGVQVESQVGGTVALIAPGNGSVIMLQGTGTDSVIQLQAAGGVQFFSGVTPLMDNTGSVGSNGYVLSSTVTGIKWIPAPAGGVSSLTGDSVVYNNAASTGAVTLSLISQTANTVFAGPTSGAATAPTFRALVASDIPSGTVIWNAIGNAAGNLTLANAGFTTTFNQTSAVPWVWANTTAAANAGSPTPGLGAVNAASVGQGVTSLSININAGDCVVVFSANAGGGNPVITDNAAGGSNVYTQIGPQLSSWGFENVYVSLNSKAATTITITFGGTIYTTSAATFVSVGAVGAFTSIFNGSASSATATVTTTGNQSLVIGGLFCNHTSTLAATSGSAITSISSTTVATSVQTLQVASSGSTGTISASVTPNANCGAYVIELLSGVTNQSSPLLNLYGQYWTGTASATDTWSIQTVLSGVSNPTSTLTFLHSGSSGVAAVSIPAFTNVLSYGNIVEQNTTVATSSTTNASPNHQFIANYWTGAASAADTWTIGSSLVAGTNGASALTLTHSGSTGTAYLAAPYFSPTSAGVPAGTARTYIGNVTSNANLCAFGNNSSTFTFAVYNLNAGSFVWGVEGSTQVNCGSGVLLGWSSTAAANGGNDTGISRLGAASLAIGNGTAGDFSGALTLGNLTQKNNTAATSSTTNASPIHTFQANYYTGSNSAPDNWQIYSQLGVGANGSSLLNILHNDGTTGAAGVLIGNGFTHGVISSPYLILSGSFEVSSSLNLFGLDEWQIQNVLGAGVEGTSTLAFTHTGTSGAAIVTMPALSAPVVVDVQTNTTYTAAAADANQLITLNNASAITWTIPTNASVPFPIGTTLTAIQLGAGQVTITAAGGVTVNTPSSLTTRAQYSTVAVVQVAANTWVAGGDLT